MSKEYQMAREYFNVNLANLKAKDHLDLLAIGMENQGMIVSPPKRRGRPIAGEKSVELGFDGDLIRKARINSGTSQDQLGASLGVSAGMISWIENNKRKLNPKLVSRVREFVVENGVEIPNTDELLHDPLSFDGIEVSSEITPDDSSV